MLIESDPPNEKQLLKANSITTKLIANSTATDNLTGSANYRHLQLYNKSLNDKMNSLSQYQLSSGGNVTNTTSYLNNQQNAASTLNRLNNLNQNGFISQFNLNHGTIRPHNQATTQLNGGLTPLQNNIISNYATISRATHNQLNSNQLKSGHLNGGSILTSQVPNSQPHLNNLNTHQIYQQLTPLNTQINHLNQFQLVNGGIYGPQFVGLEVGLDLNSNHSCCFNGRCNISRVIAFICGIIVLILMSLCITSSNWLTSDKYRQGLFQFCVDEGAEMPLPFDLNVQPGMCYPGRDTDYIRLAAILCCFGFILDLLATLMIAFGLCSNNSYKKYALYKFALYIMMGALIVILIALVIYPVFFASEIETSNRQIWEFGIGYGICWGSCIFLFGAILLLLCDKENEDLYYRERTIIHNPGGIREVKA